MSRALVGLLAILAGPAFAQSSTATTGINGTGVSFAGVAQRDVGGELVTVTIDNGAAKVTKQPSTSPAGVSTSTFSAGLSVGATLGGGFGGTGGTAGTQVNP